MPCKIQQLGVCCLWPIKTTTASANQSNNGPHGESMTSPAILWRRDDTLQSAEDDTLRSSILWRRDEHIETRRHIAIFWRDKTTNLQEQTTNGCPATPRGGGRCETTKMHALRSLHSPIQSPRAIHLARVNPFCQNQPTSRNPPCPIQSILPEPIQSSRAIRLARTNLGRR